MVDDDDDDDNDMRRVAYGAGDSKALKIKIQLKQISRFPLRCTLSYISYSCTILLTHFLAFYDFSTISESEFTSVDLKLL